MYLSVNAWDTDINIENGHLRFPPVSGGSFIPEAIPVDTTKRLFVPPETAVEMVYKLTNARIAAPPELVLNPAVNPAMARWLVRTSNPVTVRVSKTGRSVETDQFYVGWSFGEDWGIGNHTAVLARARTFAVAVAAERQPSSITRQYSPAQVGVRRSKATGLRLNFITVKLRSDKAIGTEAVEPKTGSGGS
jgi:hypothetical protein